jgi:DNA mismatch endonuclease (patch repair protein)
MADVMTKRQRSLNMAHVRSKDTKLEMSIRKNLWQANLRGYRLHFRIEGKPDLVFVKEKVAIFIDGCFWHACPICYKEPETHKEYWESKMKRNIERDLAVNKSLSGSGWSVVRVWEHEIKESQKAVIERIKDELKREPTAKK